MVEQNVALPDMPEDIGLLVEGHDVGRGEPFVPQVGPVDREGQWHQSGQIDRAVVSIQVALTEVEDFEQAVGDGIRAVLLNLKSDGRSAIHMAELLLDGVEQVFRFLLVHVEVAVACDTEEVSAQDLHPVEQRADVVLDDASQKDKVVALLVGLVRKGNHAGQDPRHLDDREIGVDALPLKVNDDVQALVQKLWKGVGGIDRERCQDGKNALMEKPFKMFAFRFWNVGVVVKTDVVGVESRLDLVTPAPVLILDLLARTLRDGRELRLGRQAVGGQGNMLGLDLLLQSGHADFEELIEI
jgi:hypothetical protein